MSTTPHCWICQQAGDKPNPRSASGPSAPLERDCACRGMTGYTHLSCLIECARIKSNLDPPDRSSWTDCSICKHPFEGGMQVGLARARMEIAESNNLPTEDEEYLVAIQMYCVALVNCLQDFNAALPLLKKALEIRWRAQGSDHNVTLIATTSLALLYTKMGLDHLALPLFEEALEGFRSKSGGRESWAALITMLNLARLHMRNGNFSDSLPLAEEAMVGFWWTIGKEHEDTLFSIETLGELHFHMARGGYIARNSAEPQDGSYDAVELERAKVLLLEASVGCRKVLGEMHWRTIESLGLFGIAKGKLESLRCNPASSATQNNIVLGSTKESPELVEETGELPKGAEKDHSNNTKKTILCGLQLANRGLEEIYRLAQTDDRKTRGRKIELVEKANTHVTKALKRCRNLFSFDARSSNKDMRSEGLKITDRKVNDDLAEDNGNNNNGDIIEGVDGKSLTAERSSCRPEVGTGVGCIQSK